MIIDPNELDTDCIFGDLWQGAQPPTGDLVRNQGFDVLVLCAVEYQPAAEKFPGVEVVHAPYRDDPYGGLNKQEEKTMLQAAKKVVEHLKNGKRVLVTCQAGLNRSGLVVAMAMHLLTRVEGAACRDWIRLRRNMALFNPMFAQYLAKLKGKPYSELAKWRPPSNITQ